MLDSDRPAVPDSDPGVDSSKPSLAQDLPHPVGSLESLPDICLMSGSVVVLVSLAGAVVTRRAAGRAGPVHLPVRV